MHYPLHPLLLKYLSDISLEELTAIHSSVAKLSDEQITRFCLLYRARRKDPQLILILTLLGFFGVAGIHRIVLNRIGMGILYLFTAGLCFIGTIVDLINYKSLTMEYNAQMIAECLMLSGENV